MEPREPDCEQTSQPRPEEKKRRFRLVKLEEQRFRIDKLEERIAPTLIGSGIHRSPSSGCTHYLC
jgi:hypothetical protein